MASTNKTTHLDLSQYIATDKPTYLVDYNGDMAKIDTAVYGNTTKATQNETNIGTLSNLNTTEKTNLVGAINEINTQVGTNTSNITSLNTATSANTGNIGTMANLTTSEKTNLVGAVNEVNTNTENNSTKIGNISNLNTSDKTNLVSSVNEVFGFSLHTKGTLGSGNNLDDITEPGIYWFSGTPTSSPYSNGFLLVLHHDNWTKQIIFRGGSIGTNDYMTCLRTGYTGASWSSWKVFTFN